MNTIAFQQASALTALPFFLRLVLGTCIIQAFYWYKHNKHIMRVKRLRKYFIVVCKFKCNLPT